VTPINTQVRRWAKKHTEDVEIESPRDSETGLWEVRYASGGMSQWTDPNMMLNALRDRYGA
jgi:hypothetical protein